MEIASLHWEFERNLKAEFYGKIIFFVGMIRSSKS
jgi:hypothetical protein